MYISKITWFLRINNISAAEASQLNYNRITSICYSPSINYSYLSGYFEGIKSLYFLYKYDVARTPTITISTDISSLCLNWMPKNG